MKNRLIKRLAYVAACVLTAGVSMSAARPAQASDYAATVMQTVKDKIAIDPDSAYVMPRYIDNCIAATSDSTAKAILMLYKAATFADIYSRDAYRYDQVDAPLSPLPDKINEWSGRQFTAEVTEQIRQALAAAEPSGMMPLRDFKSIITVNSDNATFYPFLRDFVYTSAIGTLRKVNASEYASALREQAQQAARPGSAEWAMWVCSDNNADSIMAAYVKFPTGLTGGYLLYNWVDADRYSAFSDSNRNRHAVELIREYLKNNSSNAYTPSLKTLLGSLTTAEIGVNTHDLTTKGERLPFIIGGQYAREVKIDIFKQSDKSKTKVATLSKRWGDDTYSICDTLYYEVPEYGRYTYKVYLDGKSQRNYEQTITSTPVIPIQLRGDGANTFIITDYNTGSPTGNVKVSLIREDKTVISGTTDADGIVKFSNKDLSTRHNYTLQVETPEATTDFDARIFGQYTPAKESTSFIEYVFSRPLYHPGETIEFAMRATRLDSDDRDSAIADKSLDICLYDANRQPVDTINVMTDNLGRAHGAFTIPTDRLTGRYQLTSINSDMRELSGYFTVSAFKMPVIEIQDLKAEPQADGTCLVSGDVLTLTGMAASNAEVKIELNSVRHWWWRATDETASYSYTSAADENGRFSVIIPREDIKIGSYYNISVTATTSAAETATASASLDMSLPFTIDTSKMQATYNTDNGPMLPVYIVNSKGERVSEDIQWQLLNGKIAVDNSVCRVTDAGADIDLSKYPADTYTLKFTPKDTTVCVGAEINVTTYSIDRNAVPAGDHLFVAPFKTEILRGEALHICIGVQEATVLYIITSTEQSKNTITLKQLTAGFNDIEIGTIDAPAMCIQLMRVKDGRAYAEQFNVTTIQPEINISIESWRDKLIPGDTEHWKLTLASTNGKNVSGALVASIYNHALDLLNPGATNKLNSYSRYLPTPYINFSSYDISYLYSRLTGNYPDIKYMSLSCPEFIYQPEAYYHHRLFLCGMARSAANSNMLTSDAVLEESAVEAQAPMYKDFGATDTDSSEPNDVTDDYMRKGEVLQALWQPMLTFDADGNAEISFTAPNALGAWTFAAWAWDADGSDAFISRNVTVAKPIMVQPNLPRFLREGDKARIVATIYNNTDNESSVNSVIEIFDVRNGNILNKTTKQCSIVASGSTTVDIYVDAPVGADCIGYRVKSTDGRFTDGEQDVIPVLASGTTVIDATTFYLNDKNPVFETDVPTKSDAYNVLQYCQNPMWDVIKALPALYTTKPQTVFEAANAVYSGYIAKGLNKQYPELAEAINVWTQTADSALISKLYKNEELKLATLNTTPWARVAANSTERMQQLYLTFDNVTVSNVISQGIKALERLQRADGGFAWGAWCNESSTWTTLSVLATIGRLNSWQYLTPDHQLDKVIDRAFAYVDKNTDTHNMYYVYVYSLYPDRKPSTLSGQQAISRLTQELTKNWKEMSTAEKARAAIVLHANGNKATAGQIIESLRRFEVKSPLAGISFPSVNNIDSYSTIIEAFAKVSPDNTELDAMRQWLVLRSQVTDDMSIRHPESLITAILATGNKWTMLDTSKPSIAINNKPLTINKVERYTGSLSRELNASSAKSHLTISRPQGTGVSYGSLVSVHTVPVDSVEARGSNEISLRKRILVNRNGEWIETTTPNLGEKARVQLLITTTRDLEYLTINDERPASFEPVDQLPGYVWAAGASFYRENSDSRTRLFIDYLPRGTYYLTYDMTVAMSGDFASGPATIQSQYAPEITARSESFRLIVE